MNPTFAHPDWLPLLLVVPVLALARLWADQRTGRTLSAFTAPRLRKELVHGASLARSWLIFGLQLVALAALILALCRPRWGEERREQLESGRNIMLAIDTSRSMLADDLSPNRLTRARLAAQDLLTMLPGDRIGLIAFAGQAYLQAPLTTDHDAIIESIQSLDTLSVPRGGSDITKAVRVAMETFAKTPARNHALIVFSDGGEPVSGIEQFAKRAAEKHIIIITVGVGTDAGSLIPDPDPQRSGDYVRDAEGNVVRTKLESGVLQQIANATGGRYLKLGAQALTTSLISDILASLDRQQGASKETTKPIERFQWPLSAAMLALMLAWLIPPIPRRSARPNGGAEPALTQLAARSGQSTLVTTAAVFFAALAWPAPVRSEAMSLPPLVAALFNPSRPDPGVAQKALEGGDFERARNLYAGLLAENPDLARQQAYWYGLGAASREVKDYDRAVTAFSDALESPDTALQRMAHQGLAHTLYDQGDRAMAKQPQFTVKAWTDSLRHFDAALKINPSSKDIQDNRDFVKKRLDELKQQMEQQKQQQQQQQGQKGGKDQEKGQQGKEGQKDQQSGKEGQEGQQPGDPQQGQGDQQQQDGQGGDQQQQQKQSQGGKDEQGKEQALPEGRIQAENSGKGDQQEEQQQQAEMADNERNDSTGFSRNEARSFLRTYADDQKAVQFRMRREEPFNGKDW